MRESNFHPGAAAIALRAIPVLLFLSTAASAAPVTIVDNGPPSNRVDIVFLGDGYTQSDLDAGLYDQHMQSYLSYMFSASGYLADPFPRYENFFNVHKITVASNESGADIPSQSIYRDTALDATYDSNGIERLLTISNTKARNLRNQELAGTGITADMQLATVNHNKYGGAGGSWATFAGANFSAREIALHELGHSFSELADEYVSYTGAYPDPEPSEPNVTKNPAGQKWSHWLGFTDPRGSTLNIGVYEGADYYPTGIYRPSFDSKMRSLSRPFDAVSREALIHDIYQNVNPLDDWLDTVQPVTDADLWAEVIDPAVILTQWYVDDVLVSGASGQTFHARDFGYGPGTYDVRLRAYDGILDHSGTGGLLDLVRTELDDLEQSISWSLTISPTQPGDYNGDDAVNGLDFDLWKKTFGSQELLAADGNSNGTVDAADYVVWRFYSSGAGSSLPGFSVPEAATSTLAFAALVVCGMCGRASRPIWSV